ncbi:LuxR family transcriptional regulator [Bradyrhizobium nitroreducens]|uniref:LuxR family transcriptional regulator n=1 Tax=Bradyrhizobium nitroreducens TaxID=709803 RepID=UPI000C1F26D2|nr:LuxR family transcriptional regulator [Bradyrhizobium nitroreducens]
MRRVFQTFVDRLFEGHDLEDLKEAMSETAAALNLSCFAYLSLPRSPNIAPLLISTYPSAWTSQYLQRRYERLDPVIIQTLRHPDPFPWGLGAGVAMGSAAEHEFFEEAAAFGIRCGYTIPVHESNGTIAAITFATDQRRAAFEDSIRKHHRALQLVAIYFNAHARRRRLAGSWTHRVGLSPREIECLQWAAEGKSAWETGCIMGLSRHTVAFHLDNAKAKLGVRSTIQAVARLAACNRT